MQLLQTDTNTAHIDTRHRRSFDEIRRVAADHQSVCMLGKLWRRPAWGNDTTSIIKDLHVNNVH